MHDMQISHTLLILRKTVEVKMLKKIYKRLQLYKERTAHTLFIISCTFGVAGVNTDKPPGTESAKAATTIQHKIKTTFILNSFKL